MRIVIDRDEVQRMLAEENALLIEVMGREVYEQEHIAGAISLPIRTIDREAIADLDRSRPWIVYCWDYQ